jgi:hypothetical protein
MPSVVFKFYTFTHLEGRVLYDGFLMILCEYENQLNGVGAAMKKICVFLYSAMVTWLDLLCGGCSGHSCSLR